MCSAAARPMRGRGLKKGSFFADARGSFQKYWQRVSSRRCPGRQALGPRGGGLHCVQAPLAAHQTGTRAQLALAPLRAVVRLRRPTVLELKQGALDASPGAMRNPVWLRGSAPPMGPRTCRPGPLEARPCCEGCARTAVLAKPWAGGCEGPLRCRAAQRLVAARVLARLKYWTGAACLSAMSVANAASSAPGLKARAAQGSPSDARACAAGP